MICLRGRKWRVVEVCDERLVDFIDLANRFKLLCRFLIGVRRYSFDHVSRQDSHLPSSTTRALFRANLELPTHLSLFRCPHHILLALLSRVFLKYKWLMLSSLLSFEQTIDGLRCYCRTCHLNSIAIPPTNCFITQLLEVQSM